MLFIVPGSVRYCCDSQGATAIEYALIAAGIALGIMLAVFAFGDSLVQLYEAMEPVMASMAARL